MEQIVSKFLKDIKIEYDQMCKKLAIERSQFEIYKIREEDKIVKEHNKIAKIRRKLDRKKKKLRLVAKEVIKARNDLVKRMSNSDIAKGYCRGNNKPRGGLGNTIPERNSDTE